MLDNIYFVFAISLVVGYLLGSLDFAIILSKLFYKQDIRSFGSGNAGMANILRTYGKRMATATFIGDALKGTFAVLFAKSLIINGFFPEEFIPIAGFLAAFGALLGHFFPLYFGFKGGKGVAVSAGCVVALEPILIIPLVVVFLVTLLLFKMISLGSINAAISYPILTAIYCYMTSKPIFLNTLFAAIFGAMVVYMHRDNIKRIVKGEERKVNFNFKKPQ